MEKLGGLYRCAYRASEAFGDVPGAGHATLHGRSYLMASKTVRRSVRVRRSPVPPRGGASSGFLGLLAKLAGASDRLDKARHRR